MRLTLKKLEELCQEARNKGGDNNETIAIWCEDINEWIYLNEDDICI